MPPLSLRFWQKLVIINGICMVLLAAGLMFANYWSLQRAGADIGSQGKAMLEETNRRFLASIVIGQADTIEHQMEEAKNAARIGAQSLEKDFAAGFYPEDGVFRLLFENSGPHTSTVYYLPEKGIATVYLRGAAHCVDVASNSAADADYLPAFKEQPAPDRIVAWSAVHANPYTEAYDRVIDAVSPIYLNGRLMGYLGISVSVIRLTAQFNHRQAIRGSYNFLIDDGKQLVAGSPLALVDLQPIAQERFDRGMIDLTGSGNPSLQSALHAMAFGNETVEKVFFPGGAKYLAYRPLSNANWRLGLVVPVALASITTERLTTVIAERSRHAMVEMLALSLFLLGFTLLLVAVISIKMSRPLREITAAADRISRGRIDQLISVASRDEIGILATSFNTMSRRLKKFIGHLNEQQALLAESEKQYRLLFDNMIDGFAYHEVLTDKADRPLDYRFLEINTAFERITGLTAEALVGKTATEALDTAEKKGFKLIEKFGQVAMTGQGFAFELYAEALDRWYAVSAYSPQQRFFGTIIRDITDRKRSEAELERLRHYLADIVDTMPSILIGVDAHGVVTQWNRQAGQALGVPARDAVGRPLELAYPSFVTAMNWADKCVQTGQVGFYPKQERRTREGEIRYEDVTIYPLSDEMGGAVIRVDDITERIRLEEAMVQSEKMISVGALAAGMAHEINNPLAGIMQTASVLLNRLGGNLHIKANHKAAQAAGTTMAAIESYMQARGVLGMLETIKGSGQRMADIVGNMLSFVRKGEDVGSSQRLDELMDKTLVLAATDFDLKKKYDFKRIETVKQYAADLPAVTCEAAKIQQVLLNILRNGAQAMQTAGITTPRITITIRHDKVRQMVYLDIEDNGPGMDEKTRKRVFEPFFTTKPEGTGTGLGLSVSYFIITENHDGEMTVASHPGGGAKFSIGLPVRDAPGEYGASAEGVRRLPRGVGPQR
jgi:PAS domain S-box-containing protein